MSKKKLGSDKEPTNPLSPSLTETERLVKSKVRVAEHGEVFTPGHLVESMLDLFRDESFRIDSRVLEPACGSGNFLVRVLQRKLRTAKERFRKSDFEFQQYAILAVMCIYGIELLEDNVAECRQNLLEVFIRELGDRALPDQLIAAEYVLTQNIVHGDALTMLQADGAPIVFAEWGYLGRGKFQRRDFLFNALTQMSALTEEGSLFANMTSHEIFTPVKSYPSMTVKELAK